MKTFSLFNNGHKVKCINHIHGKRKPLHGLKLNHLYTIEKSWIKKGGRKNRRKHLVMIKEIPDCVFSASRFDSAYHFNNNLFIL